MINKAKENRLIWSVKEDVICWKCGEPLQGNLIRRPKGNELEFGVETEIYCPNDGWVWFGEARMWNREWALYAIESYKEGKSPL